MEVVRIDPRSRVVRLGLQEAASDVEVRVDGAEVEATADAVGELGFELPPGTEPVGVTRIELRSEQDLVITQAHWDGALPAGHVEVDGDAMQQSGGSLVPIFWRVPQEVSGCRLRLVVEFEPPKPPSTSQRFSASVWGRGGAWEEVFRWTPSGLFRRAAARRVRLALPQTSGVVGVRFEAEGAGEAAVWRPRVEAFCTNPRHPAPRQGEGRLSAEAEGRPELIVVYVMDALRADVVEAFGGSAGATPVWDRLAGEGLRFLEHHSVAPNTLPSTKALLTGQVWAVRGGWQLGRDGPATLAEQLRQQGYRTGLFSNNPHLGPSFGVDRGFEQVAQAPPHQATADHDDAARLHEAALHWLGSLSPADRVFLYVHTLHPHIPYHPPEPYRFRFAAGIPSQIVGDAITLLAVQRGRFKPSVHDQDRLRALYLANLAFNDAELGTLLERLAERFPPERTVLFLTSDHGEELFDHGGVLHGYTLFEEMIRIPLVIWAPRRVRPCEVREPTSTLDVHRAILRAGGVEPATPGVDLFDLCGHPASDETRVHFAAASSVPGGMFSAQTRSLKIIWAPRSGPQWGQGNGIGRNRRVLDILRLVDDPSERSAGVFCSDLDCEWLWQQLTLWVARHARAPDQAAPEADEDTETDETVRRRLEALGYVDDESPRSSGHP